MIRRLTIAAAAIAASIAAGAVTARTGWQSIDFQEWRLLLRDAHAAYEREDYASAAARYRVTACLGDKNSQFALGTMYLLGQGIPPDGITAYAWYRVAAESREPDYLKAYQRLAAMIPAEFRAQADDTAERFLADFGQRATRVFCERRAEAGTRISRLECKPPLDPRTGKIEVRSACFADGD